MLTRCFCVYCVLVCFSLLNCSRFGFERYVSNDDDSKFNTYNDQGDNNIVQGDSDISLGDTFQGDEFQGDIDISLGDTFQGDEFQGDEFQGDEFQGDEFQGDTYNNPPIAVKDLIAVNENSKVIIPVLSNDYDIDGDSLNISSIIMPMYGNAISLLPGTITYTPNIDYSGTDSFGYQIMDPFGETSETIVAVHIFEASLIKNISAGTSINISDPESHFCATINDSAKCWGLNNDGQLGDGSSDFSHLAVTPIGLNVDVLETCCGRHYSCAVKNDNTVWCWGKNSEGQLGNGTTISSLSPTQVNRIGSIPITNAINVTCGVQHACIIDENKFVWCWGLGNSGRLGNGNDNQQSEAIQVIGVGGIAYLSNIINISAGVATCAVDINGIPYCWGPNSTGQLGVNDKNTRYYPNPVLYYDANTDLVLLKGIVKIETEVVHTCALDLNGSLWCWGAGSDYILGTGDENEQLVATQVLKDDGGFDEYFDNALDFSINWYSNCAIDIYNNAWCWGHNGSGYGRLGNGDRYGINMVADFVVDPITQSNPLYNITNVAVGFASTCGRVLDEVWCWGSNGAGQLGNNTATVTLNKVKPNQVFGMFADVAHIAKSDYGENFFCLIQTDDTVYCWGKGSLGQLGNNTNNDSLTPTQVLDETGSIPLSNVQNISSGYIHACASDSSGFVWCWGSGINGQLGDALSIGSWLPVQVVIDSSGMTDLTSIEKISVGSLHSCALDADSDVWCWGWGNYGQLGNGEFVSSNYATKVLANDGLGGSTDLNSIIDISNGYDHTCAIDNNGQVWCWGRGVSGQLGNRVNANSNLAVRVVIDAIDTPLTNVVKIACGYMHTCAVDVSGQAWCWGLNYYGQLGTNNHTSDYIAKLVYKYDFGGVPILFDNVIDISAGYNHTCAIDNSNIAWCWGHNAFGQLGNNHLGGEKLVANVVRDPDIVADPLGNVEEISAKTYFTCVRISDKAHCWGRNDNAQLGSGAISVSPIPVKHLSW